MLFGQDMIQKLGGILDFGKKYLQAFKAQNRQISRYSIAQTCKLGAIIKIFFMRLSRFQAIIKFWDKIYTPVMSKRYNLPIPQLASKIL